MIGQPRPEPPSASPHPEDPRNDAGLRPFALKAERRAFRWNVALVWFMRATALLWIAKGLSFWAVILGAGESMTAFDARPIGFQTTVIYFGIVDLIAAVGLWLTTAWGGVLWLIAVMSHVVVALFFPGLLPLNATLGLVYVGLIASYLAISFLAGGEE
ncbi:MAG: hypothetical protein EA385_11760 [Salinarimonadaceae bacterium]|nr:MAG: hypothetical protein EA385_11760 [Salinarimonadaceae bacterium]